MKISVMQPYFFPYIGYFSLISVSDVFVVFDNAQYRRRGWMNRNRILDYNFEQRYIHVSIVKSPIPTKINEIKLNKNYDWKKVLFKKLEAYKLRAPYYKETIKIVEKCLDIETSDLCTLNTYILKTLCKILEIDTLFINASSIGLDDVIIHDPDDWGLEITKKLNGTIYYNLYGGIDLYSKSKYAQNDIELKFVKNNLERYEQKNINFFEALSIIDVLMYNNLEKTRELVYSYKVLENKGRS